MPDHYVVILNRREADDLHSWEPVQFTKTRGRAIQVIESGTITAETGDLVAIIPTEAVSNIIPSVLNVSIYFRDHFYAIPEAEKASYPDANWLQIFEHQEISAENLWDWFGLPSRMMCAQIALSCYELIREDPFLPQEAKDVYEIYRTWIRNPEKEHDGATAWQKAVLKQREIGDINSPQANFSRRALSAADYLSVAMGDDGEKIKSSMSGFIQCSANLLGARSFIPRSKKHRMLAPHIKPYLSFQEAMLVKLGLITYD